MVTANKINSVTSFILFLSLVMGAQKAQSQTKIGYAVLSGGNVQPEEVITDASGYIEFSLKGDTLIVEGEAENLSGIYQSGAIYYGTKNEIGNLILRLKPELNEERDRVEFKPEKNRFVLSKEMMNALRKSMLYISIVSSEHTFGEIRGQINYIG